MRTDSHMAIVRDIEIGHRVRQERDRLSISRAAFARETGMPDHKLRKIESGELPVSVFELLRIAKALEVDPFDLYFPRPNSIYRGEGNSAGLEESLEIFENFVRDCQSVDHLANRPGRTRP